MIALPDAIFGQLSAVLWQFAMVFLRVGALMSVLPAFGERMIPMRVKLAVALVSALVLAPVVSLGPPPEGSAAWARLALIETGIGLGLGLGVRLFVLALQTAGSMAAQATSLSQLLGGAAIEPIPAMGHILALGGIALAVQAGLHTDALRLVVWSYDLLPAGFAPAASDASAWGVARVAEAFALAFTLAAPFLIVSLLYNLTLGVINRAMPQLMVAFVGAPAITLGALALLALSVPVLLPAWLDALQLFLNDPIGGGP
jgi:flagellar biosynthetic protein FliR